MSKIKPTENNPEEIELKRQEWIASLIKTGKEHPVDITQEEIIKGCKEIRKEIYEEIYGERPDTPPSLTSFDSPLEKSEQLSKFKIIGAPIIDLQLFQFYKKKNISLFQLLLPKNKKFGAPNF